MKVKLPFSVLLAGVLVTLAGCRLAGDIKPEDLRKRLPHAHITDHATVIASGRVVGVSDGDTLTILAEGDTPYKIRLQGIDAPEKGQDFGQKCKEVLMTTAINLPAQVEAYKQDRYGRIVAKVIIEGKDIALIQLEAGCAWHYAAYAREQTPADQSTYATAEQKARKARKGLWRVKNPQAPWEYRKLHQ